MGMPLASITSDKISPHTVLLDLYYYTLSWALDAMNQKDAAGKGTTPFTLSHVSVVFSLFKTTHAYAVTHSVPLEKTFAYFEDVLVAHAVHSPPYAVDLFDISQVRATSAYFIHTYARHYRLYQAVFTPLRVHNILHAPKHMASLPKSLAIPLSKYSLRTPSPPPPVSEPGSSSAPASRERSERSERGERGDRGDRGDRSESRRSSSKTSASSSSSAAVASAAASAAPAASPSNDRNKRSSRSPRGSAASSPSHTSHPDREHGENGDEKEKKDNTNQQSHVPVGELTEEEIQIELKRIALKAAESKLETLKTEVDLKIARQDEALAARVALLEQRLYALAAAQNPSSSSPIPSSDRTSSSSRRRRN